MTIDTDKVVDELPKKEVLTKQPKKMQPVPSTKPRPAMKPRQPKKRPTFGTLRAWHWISSALCLIATFGFAITGITLNHANLVEAKPQVQQYELSLPDDILTALTQRQQEVLQDQSQGQGPLPALFRHWYQQQPFGQKIAKVQAEWDDYEVYVGLPRAGGDRWFRVDLEEGEFLQEHISRGWIAYFNDLHKGRNTSAFWIGLLDILAIGMLIYAITGFLLLKRYAMSRKSTWPLIIAGLVLPFLLLLIPAHAAETLSEASVEFTIPQLEVAEYHRPYVAIWLSDEKHKRILDLAVLYDLRLADNEGEKWLKDMRQWWRRSGRMSSFPIDGVSGATKRPGTHTMHFPALVEQLNLLPAGKYTLNIEAAREVGGREHLLLAIELPLQEDSIFTIEAQGEHELGRVLLRLQ